MSGIRDPYSSCTFVCSDLVSAARRRLFVTKRNRAFLLGQNPISRPMGICKWQLEVATEVGQGSQLMQGHCQELP